MANRIRDLTGQRFGKLVAQKMSKFRCIRKQGNGVQGRIQWDCSCDCGKIKTLLSADLVRGKVHSCGCLKGGKKMTDLTGRKFGRLSVVELSEEKTKRNKAKWVCLCDCGSKKTIPADSLTKRNGNIKSCGCLRNDILHIQIVKNNIKLKEDPEYRKQFKDRFICCCRNPNILDKARMIKSDPLYLAKIRMSAQQYHINKIK